MKKKLFFAAMLAAILPGMASADSLSQMTADAQTLQQMGATWPQLESAAQSYAALAPYAAQEWAGQGPVVFTPFGGIEQCHNAHWDTVTDQLVPGGMNIFGDAEAEAYALQTVTVDFQQQLADYEVQQDQAGNTAVVNILNAANGPMSTALNTLMALLNTTGNQVSAALSPGTALQPLPITVWQAGIGNVPNLAQTQYHAGPNDGAPIGWSVMPASPLARLVDVCPTGTGSIPMLPMAAGVLSAAQQAVTDAPDLASPLQPLEGGSTYTLPEGMFGATYALRMSLVSALASDMQPLAGYMDPINQPLALYSSKVQQIMTEVR